MLRNRRYEYYVASLLPDVSVGPGLDERGSDEWVLNFSDWTNEPPLLCPLSAISGEKEVRVGTCNGTEMSGELSSARGLEAPWCAAGRIAVDVIVIKRRLDSASSRNKPQT